MGPSAAGHGLRLPSLAVAAGLLGGCGGEPVTITRDQVRDVALGRYPVGDSCRPRGDGPSGSPWTCEVDAPGTPFDGEYRVEIRAGGRFDVVAPGGQRVRRDDCCLPPRAD